MSSSRGYFLGQIVDDLDSIAHQVENRARLGWLDLNRMLEDFFKEVLNILLDGDFENLNAHRSNEPGLDLGASRLRIGVQVTSRATSKKVNDTLEKITADHLKTYDRICILVIGEKQGSYTLDMSQLQRVGFDEADIWDITELCRRATALPLAKLQELHRVVSSEVARVRVELELPRQDGSFPTGLDDYIEKVGRPTRSDGSRFFASDAAEGAYTTADQAAADLNALADQLAELPRISREFFALIVARREVSSWTSTIRTNADLINGISRYPNTEGELRLLADRRFIDLNQPDEPGESPYWRIYLPIGRRDGHFYEAFFGFIEENGLDVKRVLVNLDFSDFGTPAE